MIFLQLIPGKRSFDISSSNFVFHRLLAKISFSEVRTGSATTETADRVHTTQQ